MRNHARSMKTTVAMLAIAALIITAMPGHSFSQKRRWANWEPGAFDNIRFNGLKGQGADESLVPPANDNFANATAISGTSGFQAGHPTERNQEVGETNHA